MYFLSLFKTSKYSIKSFSLLKQQNNNHISRIDNLYELFLNENKSSEESSLLKEIIYSLNNIEFGNENVCLKFHNSIFDFSKIEEVNSSQPDVFIFDLIRLNINNSSQEQYLINEKLIIFPNVNFIVEYLNYFLTLKKSLVYIFEQNILAIFLSSYNGRIIRLGGLNSLIFNSFEEIIFYQKWQKYFNEFKKFETIECPKKTKLILPMAGMGTRFSNKGYKVAKPFIEVSGKPMISKAIECLPQTDSQYLGCLKDHIEKYNLKNDFESFFNGVNIVPIENVTSGQAVTCEIMLNHIDNLNEPILISACDNGIYYNNTLLQNLFNDDEIDIIVFAYKNQESSYYRPEMYSWLEIDEYNSIKHVHCKHFPFQSPLNNFAIIGTMYFKEANFFLNGLNQNISKDIRNNGEFYVDEVINRCIEVGLMVKMFEVYNYICWGTPEDLETYNFWESHFSK
jgi:dTDP-glucose pyrophosphorylase